jgi:transposase
MAKPILDDELWALIEPVLPPPKKRRRRYPGRKPIGNREALSAILFVLRTGIPWESLPQELGWGCGMTAWRRLHAWQRRGIWDKLHQTLLARLQEADKIDWSRALIDSSSVRAVHGGKKRAVTLRIGANVAASTTSSRMLKGFPWRPR